MISIRSGSQLPKLFRQALQDMESMMKTGKCPVCGGSVEISQDDDGDTCVKCTHCHQEHGFSKGFFNE
jgi:hypothetical protein